MYQVKIRRSFFYIFLIGILTSKVFPAKIEKGILEVGGDLSGGYTSYTSGNSFFTSLAPTLNYYFSTMFFGGAGLSLQYSYSSNPGTYVGGGANIQLGYYRAISEKLTMALPMYVGSGVTLYDNTGYGSSRGNWGFGAKPQLKYQIQENVLLSLNLTIYSVYTNWNSYLQSGVAYGIGWSYFW